MNSGHKPFLAYVKIPTFYCRKWARNLLDNQTSSWGFSSAILLLFLLLLQLTLLHSNSCGPS
jgi:hypothetical protein